MVVRAAVAFALFLPLVAACGGSATPAAQTPEPSASSSASSPAADGKALAAIKRGFMTDCSTRVPNAPDYCECGWEQMTRTFTDTELRSEGAADPEKLAALKGRVESTCRTKLPEDLLKGGWVKGCVGDDPRNAGYCACSWGSFRKQFSAAELVDPEVVKTERFASTKKLSVKACGPKLSEEGARAFFVKTCSKGDGELNPFCGCAWKAVRGLASAAEIQADLVDVETVKVVVAKSCSKLHPANH